MSTKIKIRGDSVEIEGYVNAVERASKPLLSERIGRFIERICAGAFKKALKRNDNVHILLNHDWDRDLGSTKQGNLELEEDSIGLHARATIRDAEVIDKARKGELVGWSFGFTDRDVDNLVERGMPLREVKDLNLYEVSILDRTKKPAYNGTLISTRSIDGEEQIHYRGDDFIDDVEVEEEEVQEEVKESNEEVDTRAEEVNETEVVEEPTNQESTEESAEKPVDNSVEKSEKIDYSSYRNMIKEMKEES